MKYLYIVRHGETDWNKEDLIQGRTDNPLNNKGRKQAEMGSNKFGNIKPQILISSSLQRARETLEIIKEKNNWQKPIEIISEFQERDFGEFEGKKAEKYKTTKDFSKIKYPLFEQDKALENRLVKGLQLVLNKLKEEETGVIAAHSHVMKGILAHYFPEKYDYTYSLPNVAILKLKIDNNKIIFDEIL